MVDDDVTDRTGAKGREEAGNRAIGTPKSAAAPDQDRADAAIARDVDPMVRERPERRQVNRRRILIAGFQTPGGKVAEQVLPHPLGLADQHRIAMPGSLIR